MKHNDSELIRRILTGDDDAFSFLMEKYKQQVHALAWRIVGDFHIAEEITQDAFLKAYSELKKLKEPQRFAGWLSVITRRCCFAWLRKKRMWTESFEHLEESDCEKLDDVLYSEYVVEEKERTEAETQREVVRKLLAKLQESERTVITLHYFGEMTCSEIGEFLGVSANTIKSRLHRAQQRLKKQEPIIRKALEHFKITPNLTENIMREISQKKPIAPTSNKPFVPWVIASSTFVLVLIMLGIGNNSNLALFQQPYSLDASSEVMVDLVEVPVVAKLAVEQDVRKQVENANVQREIPVSKQKPDDTQLSAVAGQENNKENYPQWNLPQQAKMRLGKGGMSTIQFSPDGTQLAVGSRIGVWVYDADTGKEISLLSGMSGGIVYSPDGRFLATGGEDPTSSVGGTPHEKGVVLWDVYKGSKVKLQDDLPSAAALRFSNDSKTLVCLSKSRDTIYKVDVESGKVTTTKMGERPGYMSHENYALTEDKIAIGSREGKIELWDTTTVNKLSTLREFGKEVRMPDHFVTKNHALTLKFSPEGKRLATGNLDTTVQLWDTVTGEELIVFQKPIEGNIWSITRQNGQDIVKNPMKNERNGRPITLAFSPDGTLLACGSDDCTIKLWNSVTGELISIFTGHLCSVKSLTFSPDGNTLASGSDDGTVRFWDIKMQMALKTRIAGHLWMKTASILNDGFTSVSVSSHGIITMWDLKNSQKTTFKTKTTVEEPLYWQTYRTLLLSPDSTILASHGRQSDPTKPKFNINMLRLTDVYTGRELMTFPGGNAHVFSPDGKTVASGGSRIRLLNLETGKKREIITSDHDDGSYNEASIISTLIFSPDGDKIVSGNLGGYVQMWDLETGMELSSFFEELSYDDKNRDAILKFAYSSDGSLLAVGSMKRIRIIGRAKQPHFKELLHTEEEDGETFIFSPDNTVLIVGYWGGKIRIWDVVTGDKLTTLDGHSVAVGELKFSPDNKTLISVGGGTILFWVWETVLRNARGEYQEDEPEVNHSSEEPITKNVLQFHENTSFLAKSADHILTKGELFLVNEWYEEAFEVFAKNLTAADYNREKKVYTLPSFHRQLFGKIRKAGKNVQNTVGFADMVNNLIEVFPDNLSIQLNAHLVLAMFYHDKGLTEKANDHNQIIDLLKVNLSTESTNVQLNAYISLLVYYLDTGILDKADEYLEKIDDITAELDANNPSSLKLQLDTHFGLAEYYRENGMSGKADEHIRKTGFVMEDVWMVLGPFDNAGGIGYDTAYIHEDITEIDLTERYDGLNGPVRWKKLNDTKLTGYNSFGEKNVEWQVSYAFATVVSPDEREVQFRFDSDDQGKVWLNGKEVFSHTKTYAAKLDKYTIPVLLKAGKNSILVKICNEEGASTYILRITDQDGQAFDDLKIISVM